MRKIGISGSYGGINLGDEAILHAMIAQLRASTRAEITVFSRNAEDTRARHDVEHVVEPHRLSRRESAEVVRELDLFLLGGGGILFDGDAERYVREIVIAHEQGVPSMVYAVSAGPLRTSAACRAVRRAMSLADVVTVRDHESRRLLEDLGVEREIGVTADPALLLEPVPRRREELLAENALDPGERLIGFSVRELGPAAPDIDIEHEHQLVANAADFVIERLDAQAVFVPLERSTLDVQHSHGVIARMRHATRSTVLRRAYTPGELLSFLPCFELAIGMRLHFLIFLALAEVPFVGLPYAPKVSSFLDDVGLPGPRVRGMSAGQLIAHVSRAWDTRESRREHMRAVLPALQERARRTHTMALELLERGHVKRPRPGPRGERARA